MAGSVTIQGSRAVVTGAGSGIGRATAEALAARGAALVICDVDPERLGATAEALRGLGAAVEAHALDVSDREAYADFAGRTLAGGPVNIVVSNAGVGVGGTVLDTSLDDWDWVMGVNLWGVIYGAHFFGPAMVEARRGHIVNIASAAGLSGIPSLAAYSVTKCAVVAHSESLHAELAHADVGVSVICPGFLATRILADGRIRGRLEAHGALARVERVMNLPGRRPEAVARAICQAIERRHFLVPLFVEARGLLLLRRLPAGVVAILRRTAAGQIVRD